MCSLGCGRNLPESSSFPETASPKGAGEGDALEKGVGEPCGELFIVHRTQVW